VEAQVDAVELHRKRVQRWLELLRGIDDNQWTVLTPCTEWNVWDLVNHVTYEERWVVPLMQGRTIGDVGDALKGDLLGDKPLESARHAAEEALAAFAEPGAADRTVLLSRGPTLARDYAYELAADHLIHGWDLAAATGQDRTMPEDLVEAVAKWFVDHEDAYRRRGSIAERPAVGLAASTQDRLLAAFGRDPGWSA
jgi:uncharacterized protein (TIGR03086 family)